MADSRYDILAALKAQLAKGSPLPTLKKPESSFEPVAKFTEVLTGIGGKVYPVRSRAEAGEILKRDLTGLKRTVSAIPEFSSFAEHPASYTDLSSLENVDLFIGLASLAVAENGAVWLPEEQLHERVLPFISQHVAIVIQKQDIVATMYEAYQIIGDRDYGFATFIAGPSKTADIEQSLVIGAHGATSMRVFIVEQ